MNRLQRATMGLVFTIVFAAGCLLLQGCAHHPEWHDQPQVSCEPLPTCSDYIPANATSTQLEAGLWACVLEYRAQYSSCAHRRVPAASEGGK